MLFGRGHRLGNFVVIEDDPFLVFLNVTNIMTSHSGGTHVTNECH